ncbi:MAG: hypothetical protein PHW13_09200 [Methylococcales bacterium]|nr:hypothetical protein [Methylococcales bacterium]
MKKFHKTPLAIAMGASLLPLTVGIAQADSNPFALSELGSAYMQTAEAKSDAEAGKMKEGACGEGKCGAAMSKSASPAEKKALEGKCAASKHDAAGETKKPADSTTSTGGK